MNNFTNINKKIFSSKINRLAGFTLLETLVAILLFTVALSALLALVRDSVTTATYTKNEVVATYLAQEAVDYIRNQRDEIVKINALSSITPWTDFTNNLPCSLGCELDVYDMTPIKTCVGNCFPMNISGKNFRRTIYTKDMGDAFLVKVEVVWANGTNQRTKILTTSLYNWAL